jgi:hypothetical protein
MVAVSALGLPFAFRDERRHQPGQFVQRRRTVATDPGRGGIGQASPGKGRRTRPFPGEVHAYLRPRGPAPRQWGRQTGPVFGVEQDPSVTRATSAARPSRGAPAVGGCGRECGSTAGDLGIASAAGCDRMGIRMSRGSTAVASEGVVSLSRVAWRSLLAVYAVLQSRGSRAAECRPPQPIEERRAVGGQELASSFWLSPSAYG